MDLLCGGTSNQPDGICVRISSVESKVKIVMTRIEGISCDIDQKQVFKAGLCLILSIILQWHRIHNTLMLQLCHCSCTYDHVKRFSNGIMF